MTSAENSGESPDGEGNIPTLVSPYHSAMESDRRVDGEGNIPTLVSPYHSAMESDRRVDAEGDILENVVYSNDCAMMESGRRVGSILEEPVYGNDRDVMENDRRVDAEDNVLENLVYSNDCAMMESDRRVDAENDTVSLQASAIDFGTPGISRSPHYKEGKTKKFAESSQSKSAINFAQPIKSAKQLWKGHYCCVPQCNNSAGMNKYQDASSKISFHNLPDVKSRRGKEWIQKIRRDPSSDFVITKRTKICSDHFVSTDFVLNSKRRQLKPNAVPSRFSWTKGFERKSLTSQKALQVVTADESVKQSTISQSINVNTEEAETEFFHASTEQTETELVCASTEIIEERDEQTLIANLQNEIFHLKDQLAETEKRLSKSLFRLENIKDNTKLVKFYTGFADYETLMAFYEVVLESDALVMRQWSGRRSGCDYDDVKAGPPYKLSLKEQFFLTLVRLRVGLPELDVANRFGVSQATVSRITNTWVNLMYHNLKSIEKFPSWHIVKKYMPESFKKEYPNTRIIIDATEFAVERPSSLLSQACTFSSYKNKNTVKVLIGVTPSGAISFVSEAYEGSISDRKLVEASGLLDNLESGDEVMADKGFKIQDLLTPRGIRLNIPPFLQTKIQMTANDVFLTKKIARLRVHVERSIGRVKEFKIFHDTLPASMWDCISNVIYVCCMLSNFGPPLVC